MPSLQRLSGLVRRLPESDGDPVFPPLLPPPSVGYALLISGSGSYDIHDGGEIVGWLYRRHRDGERHQLWSLTLQRVSCSFPTLKAAKAWLRNPPVRTYG